MGYLQISRLQEGPPPWDPASQEPKTSCGWSIPPSNRSKDAHPQQSAMEGSQCDDPLTRL